MQLDHRRRWYVRTAFVVLVCLAAAASAMAQTTSATVSGSVKDAQAAVLPGVNVTLTSNSQGTSMTAVTDSLGNFLFPIVKPDTYTLKIQLDGFSTIQRLSLIHI